MTDLTPERRAENMRLREAATPGPWVLKRYVIYGDDPDNPRHAMIKGGERGFDCVCDNEPYYPQPQFGEPMAISMRLDRSDYAAFASAAQAEGKGITTWIRDAAREKAGIR